MAPSPENPNQLPPTGGQQHPIEPVGGFQRTIEQTPATVSVKAGTGVISDIGNNNITERAENIRYSTDEAMIWQEAPSLALLVPRALKYIFLWLLVFAACAIANRVAGGNPAARSALEQNGVRVTSSTPRHTAHKKSRRAAAAEDATASPDAAPSTSDDASTPPPDTTDGTSQPAPGWTLGRILFLVKVAFAALYALLLLLYFFRLKTTKYSASSQRLIVEEGTWHSVNKPYELHQLGDAVILKPAILRLFEVSNLVITTPHIELYGLRNAEYVRDILRQGGQLEAQRADKIRFR